MSEPKSVQMHWLNKETAMLRLTLERFEAEALEGLTKRLGFECEEDVIRLALNLLSWSTYESEKGRRIASFDQTSKKFFAVEFKELELLRLKSDVNPKQVAQPVAKARQFAS